ncbi:hypothetical protein N431DRAFT_139410 [Stipitochalara longipes BDJ]|nr:hypothetical protein N431DRAFT_139410 [Stipitochalara longipes BDJ]
MQCGLASRLCSALPLSSWILISTYTYRYSYRYNTHIHTIRFNIPFCTTYSTPPKPGPPVLPRSPDHALFSRAASCASHEREKFLLHSKEIKACEDALNPSPNFSSLKA